MVLADGLRRRRHYDTRRTFISLALGGGASKDLLMSITHPRPADAFDMYRTPAWEALCGAVDCIAVRLKQGQVVELVPSGSDESAGAILAPDALAKGGK